jgi:tetratricopeptide (TPR) repeat protein
MWCSVGLTLSLLVVAPTVSADTPRAAPRYRNEEALQRYAEGRLLEEEGAQSKALEQYYRALMLDPSAIDVARRVSEVTAQMGDPDRSLEFADRALALNPDDPRSLWLKGAALLNLGRDGEGLTLLQKAVDRDSDQVEYVRTLARAAERMEDYDLLARSYRRVVWLDDQDAEAWFQLAAAEARRGRFGAADTAAAVAADLNPVRPGLLFLRGWIAEARGRPGEAIEDYRHHLEVHREDAMTRRRLVLLLAREKKFGEALPEAHALAKASPRDLETRHLEADLEFEAGKTSEGLAALDRIRVDFPKDPLALHVRLGDLTRHGRGKQAITEVEQFLSSRPTDLGAQLLAAQTHEAAGDLAGAITHLRRAVELAPDSLAPAALLARAYGNSGRSADAKPLLEKAHARFPDVTPLTFDLALCREKLGDLPGAEAAIRDVLKRDPENPTALNFLGYLFADHNRNVGEAVGLIQRALSHDPDNGAFLDSLGWAYYRLGRLVEARRELERAVELSGADPIVHEHLGDVYKDMKLKDLAREQYKKSLSSDGGNERVRAKLSSLR